MLARAMKPSRPWGAPTGRGSSPLGRLRAGGEEVAVEAQLHRRAARGNHPPVEVQRGRRDPAGGADVVAEFAAAHFAPFQLPALAEQVGGHGGEPERTSDGEGTGV